MKRIIIMVFTLAFALLALAACGKVEKKESAAGGFDPSALKTMGDFFACADEDSDREQEAFSETQYVYVCQVEGAYYRAVAQLPKEVSEKLWAVEFDENREQRIRELISPLAISSLENLSEQTPSQEELDKLVGKLGQDLFDDGWEYWYYNLEDMEAGMYHGVFSYAVRFQYDGEPMVNSDDFDFYEAFKDLPVSSVTLEGLGDAAYLD